jgi:hypothetical protein
MPGASPEIDQELDPFDHPQSTMLGKANLTIFMSPRHEQIQYESRVLGGSFRGKRFCHQHFNWCFVPHLRLRKCKAVGSGDTHSSTEA